MEIKNLSQVQAMAGISTTTLRCLANPFGHEICVVSKVKQTFKIIKKKVLVCMHMGSAAQHCCMETNNFVCLLRGLG